MKEYILIVEDEAILFERISRKLISEGYEVSEYLPSVDDAIASINIKRPDLVLLDINLQGEKTGIDLGDRLYKEYKIPFIYVTQHNDDLTFYQGLHTNHEDFLVKSDYNLNPKELVRKIQTVLNRTKTKNPLTTKKGIMAYVDYVQGTRNLGKNKVAQVPIPYREIAYFTTNSEKIDEEKSEKRGRLIFTKMKRNNTRLFTWEEESFVIPKNLSVIQRVLPYNFVKISDDYIVNLGEEHLEGRINGRRLKVRGKVFSISETYKTEVEKRLNTLYQNLR